MAVVAATVASGKLAAADAAARNPRRRRKTGRALRPDVLDSLRTMMRDVVTSGTAKGLRNLPDVRGRPGPRSSATAELARLVLGYTGDLAFSVLLVGGGSSTPA